MGSEYLRLLEIPNPKKKTKIWEVRSVQGDHVLGLVMWWAPWRKYTFCPGPGKIFDPNCLRCIADIVELETKKHKLLRRIRVVTTTGALPAASPPSWREDPGWTSLREPGDRSLVSDT